MTKLPPMPKLAPMPPLPGTRKRKPGIGENTETVAQELEAFTEEARTRFRQNNAKMRDDEKRFRNVTDSEYWVAICFENREQKEEFLRSFGLLDLGDKYVDGLAAAKLMGKPIKSARQPWRQPRENARWRGFVR